MRVPMFSGKYRLSLEVPDKHQPKTPAETQALNKEVVRWTRRTLSARFTPFEKNETTLFRDVSKGTWREAFPANQDYGRLNLEKDVVVLVDDERGNDATAYEKALGEMADRFGDRPRTVAGNRLSSEDALAYNQALGNLYRRFTETTTVVNARVADFNAEKQRLDIRFDDWRPATD